MKSKTLSIVLSLLMIITLVTGCDTAQPSTNDNISVIEQENIVEEKEQDSVVEEKVDVSTGDLQLEVHYIDVGQADAALLMSKGEVMLIDGGNEEDSSLIYSYLNKLNISNIDYMIGTHAHEDHMGGLAGALSKATVEKIYSPRSENDADFYQDFKRIVENKGYTVDNPSTGESFKFGDCQVELYCPTYESASDLNNTSIMAKVICGDTSFLFTGDAEDSEEHDILAQGCDVSADVLKAGHHGSDTSSTYSFIREVMPKYVIVSVGKENSYGHPDSGTLSRFRDAGAKVYRTDMQGDIIVKSNGKEISVTTERNANADTNPTISEGSQNSQDAQAVNRESQYIGNKNSKKFHRPTCHSLPYEKNSVYFDTREEAIASGYSGCKNCNP